MSPIRLKFEHISKRFGSTWANSDITLQFEPGTIVGLLGPNGAGKTTLLRQLVGLSRPTSGHIAVNGRTVIAGRRWVKDFIAYLPQHPLALGDLTVEEAIRSSALLRGQTWSHAQIQAQSLLEMLDLSPIRRRQVSQLSGGEHRLVGIASVVVAPTPIIALDEPTNELDPLMRHRIWEVIANLRHPERIILLVSHNMLEAERVLDRVLVMHHGHIRHDSTPLSLRQEAGGFLKVTVCFSGASPELPRVKQELIRLHELHGGHFTWNGLTAQFTAPRGKALNLLALWFADTGLISSVEVNEPTLEDTYLALRQGWLADQSASEEGKLP